MYAKQDKPTLAYIKSVAATLSTYYRLFVCKHTGNVY
jgi:hypothetical protein